MKKISKAIILSLPLFFALGAVLAVEISTDLTNAVQHIGSGVKILSEGTSVATLMNRNSKVKIDLTDGGNFLIRSRGDDSNTIVGSTGSNILGGKSNEVRATIGSTIIAGQGNSNIASYSTIGGGENNSIENGSNNVILGGAGNKINRGSYSTIVGGASNTVSGANSVTVGVHNGVEGNNSAALGSNAKVFANNSFLWSDAGADLRTDDVFAVISQHGMVVNTDTAHSLAQLTVGGSIVISEGMKDSEIVCTSEKGKGTMKLVSKTSDGTQKCLCSCNGQSWDSLLGDGQCKSVCNGNAEVTPQCGDEVIVLTNEDGTKHYSGSCISGEVINGSYYMSTENVWWACQESNGKVELCNYTLGCTGTIPDHGHKNNNITPDRQIQYQFNITPGAICSFSCNTGYAWYKYPTQAETGCNEICNTSSSDGKGACNFGTLKLPDATWSQEYQYWCTYQGLDYQCDMSCPAGTLWAGNSGTLTGCQPTTVACGSTKDSCVLGETSNSRSDGLYFTWECLDSEGLTIANCSISKPTQKRFVYFDREEGPSSTTIGFRLTGAINTGVQIKLSTPLGDEIYYITGGYTQSRYESYYNDTSAFDALFMNDQKTIKLPVTDTVYELEMVSTGSINICSTDFQSAGSCRYGATGSNLSSGVVGDMATFTWKCTSGSNVKTCTVSRGIKSGKCTSIPTNGTGCDANKSGCTPLRGPNLNLRDFYITEKGAGSVTSNGSGSRVHCVYNAGKISCTDSTTMEDWLGWKCNPGYNTDIDACTCSTNSACNSNQYNASCTNGSTNLGEATFTESYTYTCPATSETCNAKCADGKVWAGPSEGCINPVLCTDEDPGFNCYYGSTKNGPETVDSLKLKRWNCTIGDVYKECHKCFDGYVWNGSDKCVASSVACGSTGITAPNGIVFQVIALADGASTPVTGHDGIQYCTGRVSCNNGVDTLSNMNCTTICGDSVSNTPDCNLGSPVGGEGLTYNKVTFTKRYTFACSYEGYTYDACEASCNTNRYWSGTSCVSAPALCSSSHFGCNTIVGKVPLSTGHYTGSTNYTWNCALGDILQNCNENVPTSRDCAAVTLNGTKTTGYYVRALSDNESIQVSTGYNLGTCTATATCSNTQVTLSNEVCTPACDGEGGCNLDLTPRNYDGVTYKNEYHYNCGSFACTANCPAGQKWDGYDCITITSACVNDSAYDCDYGFANNKSDIAEGYYWDCYDGDNQKINTNRCYECKTGYEYSISLERCVPKTLSCSGKLPSNGHYTKGTGTYTYDGTTKSWTKTTGTPGVCQYKCDTYYNSGDNCDPERLSCLGNLPANNHYTAGVNTYLYAGTLKSWTKTSGTPSVCQYKCNTCYNSGTNCDQEIISCGGKLPSNGHYTTGASTYNCDGTTRSWTKINSGTPGVCQYKCDPGYNSGDNCDPEAVAGKCGVANGKRTSSKPTSNLCSGGTASAVTAVRCSEEQVCWKWTCNGSSTASCSADIPTALFDWCRSSSDLTVKVNKDVSWNYDSVNFNGVTMFDDDDNTQKFNSTSQTASISSPNISSIYEIKAGSTIDGWRATGGYILLPGSRDDNLCPANTSCQSPCRNRTVANGGTETCYSDDEPRCKSTGNICDTVKKTATCNNGSRSVTNFAEYDESSCAGRPSYDSVYPYQYIWSGGTCIVNSWVGGSSNIGEQDFAVSNLDERTIIRYYGDSYGSCKRDVFDDDTWHYPTIDDICRKQLGSINQYDNGSSCWIYEGCERQYGAYVCSNTYALWCTWHE